MSTRITSDKPAIPWAFRALCLLIPVGCTCVLGAPPDRSVHFPEGWTSKTLVDCEQAPGWQPPEDPDALKKQFAAFEVAQAFEARARGKASCRWELEPRDGKQASAELAATIDAAPRCDALSVWIKNPEGHRALFWLKLRDADGAVYRVSAVLLGEERNWQEVAFYLKDYVPAGGAEDLRPGITFPLKSVSLVLDDLRPKVRYVLYFDELRAHRGPPASFDVIELATPREIQAGESFTVRFRLRAQSKATGHLALKVGLFLDGVCACIRAARVDIPPGGVAPGAVLAAVETTFKTPPLLAAGSYDIAFTSDDAEIILPNKDRLATSEVRVIREDETPTTSSIERVGGVPTIVCLGEPMRVAFALCDATDPRQLAGLSATEPQLVRFRVVLGAEEPEGLAVGWTATGRYEFRDLDEAVRQILAAAPAVMLLPDVRLVTPQWWKEANPLELAVFSGEDESGPSRPSLSSEVWRADAGVALGDLVEHLERGPFGDHIAGYQASAGLESRWLSWDVARKGVGDYSEPQRHGFQQWLKRKYDSLERLRGAWGQPGRPAVEYEDAVKGLLSWGEVEIPTLTRRRTSKTWLLDPITHMPVVDYRLFASRATVEAIEDFAGIVKAASGDRKVCGAAYGHFMELAARHKGLEQGGHLAVAAALRVRDLDFLVGPPCGARPGAVLMPVASIAKSGKACLHDVAAVAKDPWERLAAGLERGAPACPPAGQPPFKVAEWTQDLDLRSAAEIAVIVDDESAAYFSWANRVKKPLLTLQMEELRKLGAPVDVWLLDDVLAYRIPRYRMYVFLNAFRVPHQRAGRLMSSLAGGQEVFEPVRNAATHGGGSVEVAAGSRSYGSSDRVFVWFCAPGVIGTSLSGRLMKELTGIATSVALRSAPLMAELSAPVPPFTSDLSVPASYGLATAVSPQIEVIDPRIEALGTNKRGGPALVVRKLEGAVSIYSAAPNMPAKLLRSIARAAGVHIYNDRDDRFYANRSMVALNAKASGKRVIQLPGPADIYELPGYKKIATKASDIVVDMAAGTTKLFIIKHEAEEQ